MASIPTADSQPLIQATAPTAGSIIALALALFALFVSAFCSGSEIAFFSLTPQQRQELGESAQASVIDRLFAVPERLLATILITNNLVNVAIVMLSSFAFNQIFTVSSSVLNFILQSVVLTFIILLFGEILPKLYATSHNAALARAAATPMLLLDKLFAPLSRVLMKSTRLMDRIVAEHTEDAMSKEELSEALEITHVKGEEEKDLLEGILRFGGTEVTEIMVPRIDIEALADDAPFSQVKATILESGFSRIPVYHDNIDNITGVLYAKDLLPHIAHDAGDDFDWHPLLREPFFVPENRMIDDLLEDFRRRKIHIAVVVDEFGGTQGLVTLEDVLEEIVGDIDDEYDEPSGAQYRQLPDGSYIFDGKTLLNDFSRITELDEEQFDRQADDVETLAGLLLEIKGDFPAVNEQIDCGQCHFTVLKIARHRIASIKVVIDRPAAPSPDNN